MSEFLTSGPIPETQQVLAQIGIEQSRARIESALQDCGREKKTYTFREHLTLRPLRDAVVREWREFLIGFAPTSEEMHPGN